MEKTISEHVFERYCQENSVRLSRVETKSDARTPDYDVFPRENRVIVEIKVLQANDNDKKVLSEAKTQGAAAAWSDPPKRIRLKIADAYKQLKSRSEGLHPTIIVLFDNGTVGGIDATDIKNAMYGDETVQVTRFPSGNTKVAAHLGLSGRKCTATSNRSLSAVALLCTFGGATRLSIFQNVFANCPLPTDWFAGATCRQYSIVLDCDSGFPEWFPL
jgi:hypothetical protein